MKKTYIQPEVDMMRVETSPMLAGSDTEMSVFSNDAEGINENDAVLSRRGSAWDEA